MAGVGVSAQWNEWILFRNGGDFGTKDATFGKDIGFYVFKLPFITAVIDWAFASLVIILLITVVAHYLNGGIRLQSPFQRVTPQVKAHLSVLLALLALIKAVDYWFGRYELTFSTRGVVDGATYTDVHAQLPATNLLLLISLLSCALFIVNIWRRGWVLPVVAVGLWGLVAIVAGALYPTFIQRVRVEPQESTREAEYIGNNINATRDALGLEQRRGATVRLFVRSPANGPGDRRQRTDHPQHPAARPEGRAADLSEPAGHSRLLPVQRARRRPLQDPGTGGGSGGGGPAPGDRGRARQP